ncbi:MAG: hypothetical protein VXA40_17380 [Gammaproteobacteria bacterium]
MRFYPLCLMAAIAVWLTVTPVLAEPELPRKWAGSYESHQAIDTDYYHIEITELREEGERLFAKAKARFFDQTYTADVQMEWIIDKDKLFVEMWDSAPENDGDEYDVDGIYRGSISYDLDSIFAIWRSSSGNASGTLKIKAVDEFPDYGRNEAPN